MQLSALDFDGQATNISGHEWAQTPGTTKIELYAGSHKLFDWDVEIHDIIPRSDWNASPPRLGEMEGMPTIKAVTIHHSNQSGEGASGVKTIQTGHQKLEKDGGKGFADIAYHFVLSRAADVYEGRQLEQLNLPGGYYTKGSHVKKNNTEAGVGICMEGDYHNNWDGFESFTAQRQSALEIAITCICRRYSLRSRVISYHQFRSVVENTECPGDQVIPKVPAIVTNVMKHLE